MLYANHAPWPWHASKRPSCQRMCVQAAIGGADPFDDWLSWSDEGKEWRRVGEFDEAGRRVLNAGDRVEAQPYC